MLNCRVVESRVVEISDYRTQPTQAGMVMGQAWAILTLKKFIHLYFDILLLVKLFTLVFFWKMCKLVQNVYIYIG